MSSLKRFHCIENSYVPCIYLSLTYTPVYLLKGLFHVIFLIAYVYLILIQRYFNIFLNIFIRPLISFFEDGFFLPIGEYTQLKIFLGWSDAFIFITSATDAFIHTCLKVGRYLYILFPLGGFVSFRWLLVSLFLYSQFLWINMLLSYLCYSDFVYLIMELFNQSMRFCRPK